MQFAKFDYLSVLISFVEHVCRTRFDSTESLRDSVRFRSHVPEIRARMCYFFHEQQFHGRSERLMRTIFNYRHYVPSRQVTVGGRER